MKINKKFENTSLEDIKKVDTKTLFKKFKETKDRKIREELIERHLYIAEILSKKYANRGIDYDDIYQVASIGLIYAIDRYDIDKGFEFSSFATPTIIGEIKKYFRDKGWTIRVPRRIQELSKKINNAKIDFKSRTSKYSNSKGYSRIFKFDRRRNIGSHGRKQSIYPSIFRYNL